MVWDGVTEDVTEGRRLEDALRESEERFRTFMDHSPANAWMKDEDGRYVYANRGCAGLAGRQPADLTGKTDAELWPAEMAAEYRANDLAVLAGGKPVELTEPAARPDGSVGHWQSLKFPFVDTAGRRYVGGIAVEVTERVRMADELRRRNAELRAALEQVRRLEDFITMCAWTRQVKMDGRWVTVEEFLRERLGVTVSHGISDEALGQLEGTPPPA